MAHSSTQSRSHWPIVILSSFSSMMGLLLPLVLVRLLTPDEIGHFKIFFLYLTIIPAFSFSTGIMSGLAYWAGQSTKSNRTLQTSSLLLIGLALGVAALGLILNRPIAHLFGWNSQEAILFSFALVGAISAGFLEEAAISTGKIWTGALFYSGFELFRTISILTAVYYYRNLSSVLVAHTAIISLKVLIGYLYGLRLRLVGFHVDRKEIREVWRYAFPVSLAWVFGIFVSSADQLILSAFISSSEFALYSIGCLSIAPLIIFEHAITRVVIPQMSEASSQNNNTRLSSLYYEGVNNLAFILIPSVTGLIIFAEPIIELCFTKQYSPASHYLRLYALSYLLLIIPYDALARAQGRSSWILHTFIRFSLLSLILAFLFTLQWGPMGALTAVLLSGLILRIYAIAYFYQSTRQALREFLPLYAASVYMVICIALGILALLIRSSFSDQRAWLFVAGSGFWILYFSAALSLKSRTSRLRRSRGGVLIITQSLNIGGLERMVLHLCEHLKNERQWPVSVLAYDQPDGAQSLIPVFHEKEIEVEAFQKASGFSFYTVARILKTIIMKDIQILHSQDLGSLIYASAAKICCLGRVMIVHTQHSFIHLQRNTRYWMYEKFISCFVDKLCVVSEATKKTYLEMGFSKEQIYVIQNGVEFSPHKITSRRERSLYRASLLDSIPNEVAASLEKHKDEYWILYMARFFPGKGQGDALMLWKDLDPAWRQKAVLCFVGPESETGQYEKFLHQIPDIPDSERIFMLGGHNDPQKWLCASDMYLSCSEFEGMPLGPLEAAGAGLPAVISDIPGHSFLQTHVLFYQLHNSVEGAQRIMQTLQRLQQNYEEFLEEVWNVNRPLRDQFSIQRMSRSYSLLYSERDSPNTDVFSLLKASFG